MTNIIARLRQTLSVEPNFTCCAAEDILQGEIETKRIWAEKRSKNAEVGRFLEDAFMRLADRHADGLSRIDLMAPDAPATTNDLNARLEHAQLAVLQQAEARFGRAAVMSARRLLGYIDLRIGKFF